MIRAVVRRKQIENQRETHREIFFKRLPAVGLVYSIPLFGENQIRFVWSM